MPKVHSLHNYFMLQIFDIAETSMMSNLAGFDKIPSEEGRNINFPRAVPTNCAGLLRRIETDPMYPAEDDSVTQVLRSQVDMISFVFICRLCEDIDRLRSCFFLMQPL